MDKETAGWICIGFAMFLNFVGMYLLRKSAEEGRR